MSTTSAQEPERKPNGRSIYAQLGGKKAVSSVVDTFYERVLDDPDLGDFFVDTDMTKLRAHQVQFLTYALGGPIKYTGQGLRQAHAHLAIDASHVERVAGHLGDVLREAGVAEPLVLGVLAKVGEAAREILSPAGHEAQKQQQNGRRGVERDLRAQKSSALAGMEGQRATLEAVRANMFLADTNFEIVYANQRAYETLATIAREVGAAFGVDTDDIVGGSIHRFHKNPRAVERILRSPTALPHEARFTFGTVTLRSTINAVRVDGQVAGYIVNWEDVSEQERQEQEIARVTAMVENSPTSVVLADLDLTIRYINPSTLRMLKPLEQFLPVPVSKFVGTSIDVFHKTPEHQRRLLRDDRNLPYTANIQIGPETLKLMASAVYDTSRNYLGPMVTWEVITERLLADREMARVSSMIENSPTAVVLADREFTITYINPATKRLLKPLEGYLPIGVDEMVGRIIDIYHKNPEHQRRLLRDPRNLPLQAQIQVGPESILLMASAVYDSAGEYLGPMVTWESITEKLRLEAKTKGLAETVTSSSQNMMVIAQQMTASADTSASQARQVATAAEEVNRSVQSVATGTAEMAASIKEIARNAMDAAKVAGRAVEVAESTTGRINKLGESSKDIGQVIKVITGIAQQTNLLALNATIEAARAGDAGKGFAVVANEVKELAKETARATEDISRKIEAIQGDTERAVDAIGNISTIVQKISEIQSAIASSVEEQQVTTNDIARSIGDASRGAQEIATNIAGVAEATKQAATGAASTQSSASDLQNLAMELEGLVRAD